jgi:O-antigen/teichoic acid export membrane protein
VKLFNVIGLFTSFAVGQGTFFLVSSFILSKNQFSLVANVGLALTSFTLCLQLIDFGGGTFLTRLVVRIRQRKLSQRRANAIFSALVMVRLAVLLAIAALALAALQAGWMTQFAVISLLAFLPCTLPWCFNKVGLVDAHGWQGFSGLISCPPWLVSGAYMLLVPYQWSPVWLASGLGLSYGSGVILGQILQFFATKRAHTKLELLSFNKRDLAYVFKQSGAIVISWLPGQVTNRVQMGLAAGVLPAVQAGSFVYSRNILNASNSFSLLVRRLEFPSAIQRLANRMPFDQLIRVALTVHSKSILTAVFISAAFAIVGLAAPPIFRGTALENIGNALWILLPFAPLVIVPALSGAVAQTMHSLGRVSTIVPVNYLAVSAGLAFSALFIGSLGTTALIFGSYITNIVQLAGSIYCLYLISGK